MRVTLPRHLLALLAGAAVGYLLARPRRGEGPVPCSWCGLAFYGPHHCPERPTVPNPRAIFGDRQRREADGVTAGFFACTVCGVRWAEHGTVCASWQPAAPTYGITEAIGTPAPSGSTPGTGEEERPLRLVAEHRWSVNAMAKAAEHVTDGRPCWCEPTVQTVEGGQIITHRRAD